MRDRGKLLPKPGIHEAVFEILGGEQKRPVGTQPGAALFKNLLISRPVARLRPVDDAFAHVGSPTKYRRVDVHLEEPALVARQYLLKGSRRCLVVTSMKNEVQTARPMGFRGSLSC